MQWPWRKEETELQREIEHHLAELAAAYQRQGHTPTDARRMAEREFGGPEQVKEELRDLSAWAWLSALRQDLTFGWRTLRRTPVVTAAAVLSLALGIGANSAIVSMMHTVMWKSLGVAAPERLSIVHFECAQFPRELVKGAAGSMRLVGSVRLADFFSYRAFHSLRSAASGRADIAAYNYSDPVSVSARARASVAHQRPVSGSFFRVLQPPFAEGRPLVESDDAPEAPAAVVLSHRFRESFFGGQPGVVGQTLVLDNRPHRIVGVLAPGFRGLMPGDPTDVYVPLRHGHLVRRMMAGEGRTPFTDDSFWWVSLIARRFPGVDATQVQPILDAAWQATWPAAPPKDQPRPKLRLDDGRTGLTLGRGDLSSPLLLLGALVSLVLLIACANIANLLTVRAMARRREVALRVSLGCSQSRLMRQFLTESALLAVCGGAAGVAVAFGTAYTLARFLAGPDGAPIDASLNPAMLAFTAALTLLTLALFGVFPAWRSSRVDTASGLKETSGVMGIASHGRRWRPAQLLVSAQIAFSLVLVACAFLFVRNLRSLQNADPGFDRRNLILFGIRPGTSGYSKDKLPPFYDELERRLGEVPGVTKVGLSWMRPMNVGGWWGDVIVPGSNRTLNVAMNAVTPGFLEIMAPQLLSGRSFHRSEIEKEAKVAIVAENLALELGAGRGLAGGKISLAQGPSTEILEVIGVAPTFASNTVKERRLAMWVPFRKTGEDCTVLVRTSESPSRMLPAIRNAMAAIDANLPLIDAMTMDDQVDRILLRERMFATLCGAFGALALLLSVIGLYGMVSYGASRRQSEIGIRMALGASRRGVVWLVAREGMLLTLAGLALGAPAIWFGAPRIQRELSHLKAIDPLTLAATFAVLLILSAPAAAIPALRAARSDAARTLRAE